jgi:hypothetical protein
MTAFADEQSGELSAPEGAGEPQAPAGPGSDPQGAEDPLAEPKGKAKLSDSLQREIRRLHGVLKATKEQNRQLRAGIGTRDSALGTRDGEAEVEDAAESDLAEPDEAQAAADQFSDEPNEEGLVDFAGMRLTPEMAERLTRAEQLADRLERLEGDLGQRAEEELFSEMAELASAFEANTGRAVIELRRQIIPLEGEAEQVADEVLLALVNQDLARATREEGLTILDLTPEKIHEFGLKAVDRLYRAFGVFGAKQLQSNQQYRETHRAVRPGGSPAVQPPKGWKQMTPAEREDFLSRSAAAVLRRGSGG